MLARTLEIAALVAGVLALSPGAYAAGQCASRELVSSFGVRYSPNLTLDVRKWSAVIPPSGQANFSPLSFRFSVHVHPGVTDRNWNIVFRDDSMRVLAIIGPADFAGADGALASHRWTSPLAAPRVTVDLLASQGSDVVVDIDQGIEYPAQSTDAHLFSIQGSTPSWNALYDGSGNQIPKRAGDATGMLLGSTEGSGSAGTQSWCCSGVMVAPDLMLTNWHCGGSNLPDEAYWNAGVVANTLVDLAWDGGASTRQYSGVEKVMAFQDLDFALIRVRPVVGSSGSSGGAVRARISLRPVTKGESIFLIHHAQCQPKLLSSHCNVIAPQFHSWTAGPSSGDSTPGKPSKDPDFTHTCDTEPGSSGGAVFDEEGLLVGLHHLGFERDDQCEPTDKLNKAVRIGEIIERIRKTQPELLKEFWIQ